MFVPGALAGVQVVCWRPSEPIRSYPVSSLHHFQLYLCWLRLPFMLTSACGESGLGPANCKLHISPEMLMGDLTV